MILSLVIVAIGLLAYWYQAHQHTKWVKMQKGLAEIEIRKAKIYRRLYEKEWTGCPLDFLEEELDSILGTKYKKHNDL